LTNPPAFWQHCLDAFRTELTPQQFGTWIRPLVLEDTGEGFRLLAPNRFVLQWVKERFAARIAELAESTEGRPVDIVLAVASADPGSRPQPPARAAAALPPPPVDADRTASRERPVTAVAAPSRRHESTSLNPEFSFANFVSGKANQLARAAAMQVAGAPTSYNPLFVYGGVGLGKTHLIQAIGNDILGRDPAAKIRYVHAESYVSDVVRAYQHKSFDDFKRYYRSLDLLLIDDIQFFNGKSRTQEEFFYLFNTLL
jgi:chromosomal replication initiator protein